MPLPPAFEAPIFVTQPLLPGLGDYHQLLQRIWGQRWLTNMGEMHTSLEGKLCKFLRARHLSLVSSATMGLLLACKALELRGEVITTPFTFPATPNILTWNGIVPVFADVDPVTMTLSPQAVERAITPKTTGILAVHVYGIPCDVAGLQDVADRHGLHVLYDAAHAFGTEIDGVPIGEFGQATVLSFHATKLFHTAEGGAVVTRLPELKSKIDLLRNFGIRDEVTTVAPGINGKMTELHAALGLTNLLLVEQERQARAILAEVYRSRLSQIDGVSCAATPANVRASHQYFVVRIRNQTGEQSRDRVYEAMKGYNVFTRRYFNPLCSQFDFYKELRSSDPNNLRNAATIAEEVLCLPYYGSLGIETVHRICDMIKSILG